MKSVSKEVKQKLSKLIKEGKVEWLIPQQFDAPITVGKWTFTAVNIAKTIEGSWFSIHWSVENCGFGNTDFHQREDGKITADDECMGRDFVAALLTALLVRTTLSSEKKGSTNG